MTSGDAVEEAIDEHVSVKDLLRGEPAPGAKPPGREGVRRGGRVVRTRPGFSAR